MQNKIRMGVIGLGQIAPFHIQGIEKSNDSELFAVCDINKELLKTKADEYGIQEEYRFTNYKDLLKCSEVDAVSICTPNDIHYKIAMDAIKYNKPYALEKPVTLNVNQAEELRNMTKSNELANMVCFSYRFKGAARYAKWLIEQGYLGEIYHVYGQYFQGWGIMKEVPLEWRFMKERAGSGALGDLGSHMIDLTRFIVGEFSNVCGQAGTFIKERKKQDSNEYGKVDVDDFFHYMAELEGGISATFAISRFAFGRGNYQRIEIYGTRGSLIYSLEDEDTISICIGEVYGNSKVFQQIKIPSHFYLDQMQAFNDIINGQSDGMAATIEDGYKSQIILDALIESYKDGKWVKI